MLIETTVINSGGETFNRLTSSSDYWSIGYENDLHVTIMADGRPLMAVPVFEEGVIVDGWIEGNSVTDGVSNGFGASSFEELWAEIKNRGLILPQEVLDVLISLGYN